MGFFTPKKIFLFIVFALYWYFFWSLPSMSPLIPSLETTFFTSPVDKNGFVNYAAAWNNRNRKPVPRENAAIPLLKVVGKECWPSKLDLATFTNLIGELLPLPMSAKFIPYTTFASSIASEVVAVEKTKSRNYNQIGSNTSVELPKTNSKCEDSGESKSIKKVFHKTAPWNSKEYPLVSAWIMANAKSIEAMKKASSCKEFFWPQLYRKSNTDLGYLMLFMDGSIKELAICMNSQAMKMIHDQNLSGAIDNISATCRVGLLLLGSDWIVQDMVGAQIFRNSLMSILPIINSDGFSFKIGKQLLGILDSLSPIPDGAKALKVEYIILPMALLSEIYKQDMFKGGKVSPLDFNFAGKLVFNQGQILCKFLEKKTVRERLKTMNDVRNKLNKGNNRVHNRLSRIVKWLKIYFFTHRWAKRAAITGYIHEILTSEGTPDFDDFYKTMVASKEALSMFRIAIQLRMFKLQHDEYPASLQKLKSAFPNISIIDSFTDKPLKYRREGQGCVFYSLGPDQIDDGGNGECLKNMDNNGDLVISFKD